MADKKLINEQISILATALGQPLAKTEVEAAARRRIYIDALAELTDQEIKSGFSRCNRECGPFFPTLKEIIEKCRPPVSTSQIAMLAFESAARIGGRQLELFQFEDPLIGFTIDALGGVNWWSQLGHKELNAFVRPRFLETYAMFLASPPNRKPRIYDCGALDDGRNTVRLIGCDYKQHLPRLEYRDQETTGLIEELAAQKTIGQPKAKRLFLDTRSVTEADDCICHKTVVGKSECPVHGPPAQANKQHKKP